MLSRPKPMSVQRDQIDPALPIPPKQKNRGGSRPSGMLPKLFTGLLAAGLTTFVLLPFTSALTGTVTKDFSPIVDMWLALLSALVVFSSTAAVVLKGSTLRAVLGRGLASLGVALIISPVGISVLFALYLQDWVSVIADTFIEQAGRTAASLFGGLFAVNALAMGLALGCLSLLLGFRLMQIRPEPLVSP
ncbi:hypothetical protein [Ruegeria arenilitoris]|uniref:hypothetical protein n=1 Tax=Ruegeria arenilitoris TaxID=1173585 RepID=UPI00147D24EF|nr:hypothetical protein [Ruegeria arenilitoris]